MSDRMRARPAGTATTFLSPSGADFKGSKPAPGLKALEEKTFGGKLVASQSFGKAAAPYSKTTEPAFQIKLALTQF